MSKSPSFGSSSKANDVAKHFAPADAASKVAIVTGASSGLGIETTRAFASIGVSVVMACRQVNAGEQVANEIRQQYPDAKLKVMALDLASGESIRKFVQAYEGPIHYLINNAGVMACDLSYTKDGFEMQFGTNHMGHFLLTTLLLDKVKGSAPARIINLSSSANRMAASDGIRFNDLRWEQDYNRWTSYGNSKLANILFTRELQRRLNESGNSNVIAIAVHPGVIPTPLSRHLLGVAQFLLSWVASAFLKSPQQGAATTIYTALAPDVVPGEFYMDCRLHKRGDPYHAHANDDAMAAKLWTVSEELWAKASSTTATTATTDDGK